MTDNNNEPVDLWEAIGILLLVIFVIYIANQVNGLLFPKTKKQKSAPQPPAQQYQPPPPRQTRPVPPPIALPMPKSPPSLLEMVPKTQYPQMQPPSGLPNLTPGSGRARVRCNEQENMFGGGTSVVCEEL